MCVCACVPCVCVCVCAMCVCGSVCWVYEHVMLMYMCVCACHHREVCFYTGTALPLCSKYTSVKLNHTQLSRYYHLHSLVGYSAMHSASIRDASMYVCTQVRTTVYGRGRGLRGPVGIGWCACDKTNIINHVHAHLVGFGGVCMGSVHYAQCFGHYQTWGVGSTVTASTCVTSVVCVTM